MSFQRVPDTALVTVSFELDGDAFANTFYYEADAGYSQGDLDTLGSAVDGTPAHGLLALLQAQVTYTGTTVQGLNSINDLSAFWRSSPLAGGVTGVRPLPINVAFVVSKRSGLSGRSARGRVYIGGLPSYATYFEPPSFQTMYDTAVAQFVAAIDAFRTVTGSLPAWQPVLVSRYTDGAKRAEAVTFNWTATIANSRDVRTRRDRL